MENELIENNVKELERLLNFFSSIQKPPYQETDCPFRHNHYSLSEATSGLGKWKWNCRLCGEEDSE